MNLKSLFQLAFAGLVATQLPLLTAQTSLAQSAPPPASFKCMTEGNAYVTVAVSKNGTVSNPMIAWTTEEFSGAGYTPQRRCEEVTTRLNSILNQNGGTLSGLQLTIGPVNGQLVLCSVNNTNSGCNGNNMLFTLSEKNRRNSRKVLEGLLNATANASGNAMQESADGQLYVNLETLVNQLFK